MQIPPDAQIPVGFAAWFLVSSVFCNLFYVKLKKHVSFLQSPIFEARALALLRLIMGLLSSAFLLCGHLAASAFVFLTALSLNYMNVPGLHLIIRHPRQLSRPETKLTITPLSEEFLYTPVLFALIVPSLLEVSSPMVRQFCTAVFHIDSTLAHPDVMLVILFIVQDCWTSLTNYGNAKKVQLQSSIKSTLVSASIGICYLINILPQPYLSCPFFRINLNAKFSNVILLTTVFLSLVVTAINSIPTFWYANCISLLNLLCGLVGLYFCLFQSSYFHSLSVGTVTFVLFGQFLDLFDGRAAERWGSTPNGEMFDDVADGTSFGLCIGSLLFRVLRLVYSPLMVRLLGNETGLLVASLASLALSVVYISAIIFRLAKFILNKRRSGISGGVFFFLGLPSPGTAACVGIFCILFEAGYFSDYIVARPLVFTALLLALCELTISNVPYAHFGRVFSKRGMMHSRTKAVLISSLILSMVYGVLFKTPILFLAWFGTGTLFYVFSPLYANRLFKRNKEVHEQHQNTIELILLLKEEKRAYKRSKLETRQFVESTTSDGD